MSRMYVPKGGGALNQRIELQAVVGEEAAPDGQMLKTWGTVATKWCSISQARAGMAENADQIKATQNGIITMRHFKPRLDPTTHRFLFEGRVLWISGVDNVNERDEWYRISYHEVIGSGAI
jgi:head-tail adaptor